MRQKLGRADQFYTVNDEYLRLHFIGLADQINEIAKQEIVKTYNDPKLREAYQAWRNFNDLQGGFTKKKTMREIVRIPAGYVYEFIKSVLAPVYGDDWMRNRKALRNPLVRPWWIVSHI